MAAPSSALPEPGAPLAPTRRFEQPLRVRDLAFHAASRRHLPTTLEGSAATPAGLSVEVAAARVPPSRPNRFAAVTGAPYDGRTLPPTFAPSLFVAPTLRLLTDETFPLSPLGWVQTHQTFREELVLFSHQPVAVHLRLQALEETHAGPFLHLEQRVTFEGRAAWTGAASLLLPRAPGQRGLQGSPTAGLGGAPLPLTAKGDAGLAFAWATGDAHPHRLTPRTARPLGYADPIAHEPWLLARTHALLADRFPRDARLGGAFSFPAPFVLPGEARVHAGPLHEASGQLEVALVDTRTGEPPLVGTFSVL